MEQEDWGRRHGNHVGSCPSRKLSTDCGIAVSIANPAAGVRCVGIAGAQPLLPKAWSRAPSPRSGPGACATKPGAAVMCVAWVRVMRSRLLCSSPVACRNSRIFHLCHFTLCLQVFSGSTFYGLCLFCMLLRFMFRMNLVEVIFCFYLFSRKRCLLKRSTSHILLKKDLKKQTHNNLSCVRCSDKALSERYGTFKLCSKT